jgi:DNA-binding transcriptional MerR regulator
VKERRLFGVAEAARKIGVTEDVLAAWLTERIITPSVLADNAQPLFDEADLAHLTPLRQLHDMGYDAAAIKKIAKKIGLPAAGKKRPKQKRIPQYLTVGELATQSGINARTIKYWEERGIIDPATRSEGGFRLYEPQYVLFCRLIQDLQLFGYSLEEIKDIADLFRAYQEIKNGQWAGAGDAQLDRLKTMNDKIAALYERMGELTKGMERWRKLLKERQAEIRTLAKNLAKARDKAMVAPTQAENPS